MSFLKPHLHPATADAPPAPADRGVETSLHALGALAEARTRTERVILSELQRMEDSFIVTLKTLEDRLATTQAELAEMQRRYDGILKSQLQNERHIQTLKELKRVLESV